LVRHRVQHPRRCRLKIRIVSDRHDRRQALAAAVSVAKALGGRAVLHCGNPVAPSALHAIVGFVAADPPTDRQLNRTRLIVIGHGGANQASIVHGNGLRRTNITQLHRRACAARMTAAGASPPGIAQRQASMVVATR
jgi:predicted phosphodiesterase